MKQQSQEQKIAFVRTIRYRYLKDRRTGRYPTYTEWELHIDNILVCTGRSGARFTRVGQFIKWAKEKYSLTQIEKRKPESSSLGFNAQSL